MHKSFFTEKRLLYFETPQSPEGVESTREERDVILQQSKLELTLERLKLDLPGNAVRILHEVTDFEPVDLIGNPNNLKLALMDLAQCVENNIFNRDQCLIVLNALGIAPARVIEALNEPAPLQPTPQEPMKDLTLNELKKDSKIAALRRRLGPTSFDTAVKVERLLTDHPDWKEAIRLAIQDFAGVQEDDPSYPRLLAMVKMIIWKESGGNPNMDDSRTWGQTVRTFKGTKARFSTSACGLTGSRAASEGTQAFICEEAERDPSIFTDIPELKSVDPGGRTAAFKKLPAEKRKLIAKRVLKRNPRVALRHGVKHLIALGGKGVARMPFNLGYFTMNVGPGNVKSFERYVAQNPTPENYNTLPGFNELPPWARVLTQVKRGPSTVMLPIAVRRYEYAQASGRLGEMILRFQNFENSNPEIYALIAGSPKSTKAVAKADIEKPKKEPDIFASGNEDLLLDGPEEDAITRTAEVMALKEGVLVAVQEVRYGGRIQYRCRIVYKGYGKDGRPIVDPQTGEQKRFRKTYVIDRPTAQAETKIAEFKKRMEIEGVFDPAKRIWHTTETTLGKTKIAKGERLGDQLIVQAARAKKKSHKTG